MPQAATITINDGATTPVAHALTPMGNLGGDKNVFVFQEQGSTLEGNLRVEIEVRPVTAQAKTRRERIKLVQPRVVTQTVNGVNTSVVLNEDLASVDYVVSKGSTVQERKNLRVLLANLLTNSVVAKVLDDQEAIW